jgi:hypothetical protein
MQILRMLADVSRLPLNDATGLVRVLIARVGEWTIGVAKLAISREDLADIAKNFRNRGEMVINYGDAARTGMGLLPPPGRLISIEDAADKAGVLWGLAELTEGARKRIAKGEYQYFAPIIDWKAIDKASGAEQGATLQELNLVRESSMERLPAIRLTDGMEKGGPNMDGETIFDNLDKLDIHLDRETDQKMKVSGLDYAQAYREVARENPALIRLREALYRQGQNRTHESKFYRLVQNQLEVIEGNIENLVREAQQAHPELTYGGALKLLASEDPGLFQVRENLWRTLHET